MSRPMKKWTSRAAVLLASAVVASPLAAQQKTDSLFSLSRLSGSVHIGQFSLSGGSEAFELFDAALSSGTSALSPRVTGAALRWRARERLYIVASAEMGKRTMNTTSQVQATNASGASAQETTLELNGMQTIGAQWHAWTWKAKGEAATSVRAERLKLFAGAGLGRATYALRQTGTFVDAARRVAFTDDLQSKGSGSIGYLNATAEVPVTRWAAVQLDLRRQFGGAGMNGDFSTFDKLDLSGTRYSLGVVISPWR
jgi:hypothetical protein